MRRETRSQIPLGVGGGAVEWVSKVLERLPASGVASVTQIDAAQGGTLDCAAVSTDPPYYDNIGYADLSDFFYIWLRRSLKNIYPTLFSTLLVPKAQELIATPYRFGGDAEKAKSFFEEGLTLAFRKMRAEQSKTIR